MRKTSWLGAPGRGPSERVVGLLCMLAAGVAIATFPATTAALAQERSSSSKPATAGADAAVGAGSAAGDVGNVETGEEGSVRLPQAGGSESLLSGIANASGPVVVVTLVIATMSFYLIALVVWMALNYRTSRNVPGELLREVQELLDQTKYNEAYHRLVGDSSFLARVLAAGVRKLPSGLAQAQRASELANESATMEMEHRTTYLATVGTLGPMIGLVGTVYGMIIAFRVIAVEGSTPQANQLAAGISTALYATLEGIAISIPAIFFYALYRNRIARLSLEVGMTAELLLEQFAPGIKAAPQHSPGPGPANPPAAAHPHPFAVSAALAAASTHTRPALPSSD
jgi:biopolymer transport protein ExbB